MHGARGGAPEGERNGNYRHGARTKEAIGLQEAQALQDAIFNAVRAYSDFLERHGLIWGYGHPDDPLRLKAQALVVTLDYGDGNNAIDITLKDGALDRLYGDGVDPDPY